MKIIIHSLIFFSLISLFACDSCITQESQYDPNFATVTMHEIDNAQCSCQCTTGRDERNRCLECEHNVAAIPQEY